MDKIIKKNISRTWWALDEVIGTDTKYEGNDSINSLNQIIELLHKYKPSDEFNYINKIISDTLVIYNQTLTDLKNIYSDIYSNLPDPSIPTKLYINGWKGHLISIFIEYISDNIYNVGVINCGEGSDIHGYEDNHVFGIIVFTNITRIQIERFDNYIIRYKSIDDNPYQIIYLILFYFLGNYRGPLDNNPTQLQKEKLKIKNQILEEKRKPEYYSEYDKEPYDIIEAEINKIIQKYYTNQKDYNINNYTNVLKYKTYSQIIGSCAFTNIIYFIYYNYCKNNLDNHNNLDNYLLWYNYLKIQFKKEILNEILEFSKTQTITLDLYNIYNYIKIIIETDQESYPNIVFRDEYDKYMITQDKDITFKPTTEIFIQTFKSKFDTKFNKLFPYSYITSEEFYDCFRNNNHSFLFNRIYHQEPNFINDLKILISLFNLYNDFFDCKYIFYYELYEILKIYPLDIIINLNDFTRLFYFGMDYIFLFRIIIVLCYKNKNKTDKFTTLNSKKKLEYYMKKIDLLPIMTNNYIKTIKKIRSDIIENIQYLPDIEDYNNPTSKLIKKNDSDKLFYKIYNSNEIGDKMDVDFNYDIRASDNIYFNNLDDFNSWQFLNRTHFNYAHNKNIIDDQPYDLDIIHKTHNYNENMTSLCDLESYLMKEKDNKNENNIKLYYKYIYLCYVNNIKETYNMSIIIKSFDNFLKVDLNLNSKFYWIYLIYTNIYKTKLIDNIKFNIKDNIYSKYEENFFKNIEELKCDSQVGHLYNSSIFSMYVYQLNINYLVTGSEKSIYKKNLYIHYNKETKVTIDLFDRYIIDNKFILNSCKYYILLNFNLKMIDKDGEQSILFTEKKTNNEMVMIYNIKTNKSLINSINAKKKLYCERKDSTEMNNFSLLFNKYKDFYNLLQFNDPIILIYNCNKNIDNIIIYYQLNKFDLLFYAKNDGIYYDINDIRYRIEFNIDELFGNYDILKLINIDNHDDIKYLCLFDLEKTKIYKDINYSDLNSYAFTKKDDFISFSDSFKKISPSYRIINTYNNEIIIKNTEELVIILTSCLFQNTSMILLKCFQYIMILYSNINNRSNILNFFNNIFALPLKYLLERQMLKYYHIYYYQKLYQKYNYDVKINNIGISETSFTLSDDFLLHFLNGAYVSNDINHFDFFSRINYELSDQVGSIPEYELDNDIPALYIKFFVRKDNKSINNLIYFILITLNNQEYNESIELIDKMPNLNIKQDFIDVLEVNINNFNKSKFNESVTTYCDEYYKYLIQDTILPILPVQELIMGIGKTSIIIPYTCLRYINDYLLDRQINYNKIFIVLPENLIFQTFEIIITNIFSIFKKFIPLIYNSKNFDAYNNLYTKILLIIISDKDFKQLWLEKCDRIFVKSNYIVFYDEVDMLANPLTCELNIPTKESEKEINTKQILEISKKLYSLLENELWDYISRTEFREFINDNKIHRYLINYNDELHRLLTEFFKCNLTRLLSLSENQTNYIINTICTYLLQNQYNYNYGIPKNYNDSFISENYKFKAIPYKGIDDPLYGSEISDPLLNQILTYFCYRYMNNSYRIHDYRLIIKILEETSNFSQLKKLFNKEPSSLEIFKSNKEYYINNIKPSTNLHPDTFTIFLNNILIQNNKYYEQAKNISFTDLLINANVPKFIALTGTPYIKLPKQIIRGSVEEQTITKTDVEKKIRDIILDVKILEKFYTIEQNIDEVIFTNLHLYNVLVDIGAIFVNYNINKFIDRYKDIPGRKKYIIYFEDGIKIYNLDNNYFDILGNIPSNDYFFYFSNKNITGVDAKKYMPKNAKGLVTVTNKTIERDFAQGIFRMRQLLEGQKIDVYMSNNSYNISIHIMQGGSLVDRTSVKNIRQKFIRLLQFNQTNIENQKEKVLYKQNIFALSKLGDEILQYEKYDKIKNFKTLLYNNIFTLDNYVNIDEENIKISYSKLEPRFLEIFCFLKRKYDTISIIINTTQVNLSIQQQQNFSLNVKQEMETTIEFSILQNLNQYLNFKSDKTIKSIDINGIIILDDNSRITQYSICFLCKTERIDSIFALYKIDTKQLFLVDKHYLYCIFSLTDPKKIKNFILFDYYKNLTFGVPIDEKLKLTIFITIKYYIINIPLKERYKHLPNNEIIFTVDEIKYIFENKYKKFFTFIIEQKEEQKLNLLHMYLQHLTQQPLTQQPLIQQPLTPQPLTHQSLTHQQIQLKPEKIIESPRTKFPPRKEYPPPKKFLSSYRSKYLKYKLKYLKYKQSLQLLSMEEK